MSQQDHPRYETRTGIPLERVYRPSPAVEGDYRSHVGDPGEFPYTRGIDADGYRSQLWVMGQYSGFGDAEETNKRFRYLLERGQTGFSIALDLPTQLGMDSDEPEARREVGRVGVAIDTLDDIHRLFHGIDLAQVRQFRTSANSIGPVVAAMFLAFAEEKGVPPTSFRVLLQNDSLKEYPARGTWIYPPAAALKLSVDVIEHCARELPDWNAIQFCGAHYREAGATAVQELAFAFADAIAYIDEARRRGLEVDHFAETFYLFVYVHTDVLEEVAKLRAARRLWARLMRRYGAQDAETEKLKIFVWCGGSSLTTQQPLNNVVRVAIEALAAAMGGVQTMATASYDEGLALPTERSSTLALRTQQIVAYESGVTQSTDPLGGSYLVESLTDEIEEAVTRELDQIAELGGAVEAIESGYFASELSAAAYQWQRDLESGAKTVVGVNRFEEHDSAHDHALFPFPEGVAERQTERLTRVKAERDEDRVEATLKGVREAAASNENTIPALVPALKARATLGEICRALRDVYGVHQQQDNL